MNKLKTTITEQLQQLQMLMQRTSFSSVRGGSRSRNPHRGQGRVLAMLKIKPEMTQKELTFLLGLSKPAITELLTKLEKSGSIIRRPSENDKRLMVIQLTEKGRKAADNIDEGESEAARFLDCLNEEELVTFSSYLTRMIQHFEEQFPDEDFERRQRAMAEFMSQHDQRRGFCEHSHGHGMYGFNEPMEERNRGTSDGRHRREERYWGDIRED